MDDHAIPDQIATLEQTVVFHFNGNLTLCLLDGGVFLQVAEGARACIDLEVTAVLLGNADRPDLRLARIGSRAGFQCHALHQGQSARSQLVCRVIDLGKGCREVIGRVVALESTKQDAITVVGEPRITRSIVSRGERHAVNRPQSRDDTVPNVFLCPCHQG